MCNIFNSTLLGKTGHTTASLDHLPSRLIVCGFEYILVLVLHVLYCTGTDEHSMCIL